MALAALGGWMQSASAQPPTVVSIERHEPMERYTNADKLTWRVTFSEDVVNVDRGDFRLIHGVGTSLLLDTEPTPISGSVYDMSTDHGTIRDSEEQVKLEIQTGNNIEDTDGNALVHSTPSGGENVYSLDNTKPTVTITGEPAMPGEAFTATFTFSEGVSGLTLDDIVVGNGSASNLTGTDGGTTYTATITPDSNAAVTIDVRADGTADRAGNGNVGTSTEVLPVGGLLMLTLTDTHSGSEVALSPAFDPETLEYTARKGAGARITITGTGMGTVTYHDEEGGMLNDEDARAGLQTTLVGGRNVIVVRVEEGDVTKEYRITVTKSADARMTAVVLTSAPKRYNGTGQVTRPGTYGLGETIEFTVTFDKAIDVDTTGGVPGLVFVLAGGNTLEAAYHSGSGTTQLVFRYEVQGGDRTEVGLWVPRSAGSEADALRPNGGRLTVDGNETVSYRGTVNRYLVGDSHLVDGRRTGPYVESVETISAPLLTRQGQRSPDTYGRGEWIEMQLTMSEPVNVQGTPKMEFWRGGDREAEYERGSGTREIVFRYTVQEGDVGTVAPYTRAVRVESGSRIYSAADTMQDADIIAPGGNLTGKTDGTRSASDLTHLRLSNTDTGAAIALEPEFDVDTTTYTANARGSEKLTVNAGTDVEQATIRYLDGSDMEIQDEDGVQATGLQTSLDDGENVVKVRVQAGPTMREYVLAVTKGSATVDLPDIEPGKDVLVSNVGQPTSHTVMVGDFSTSSQQGQVFRTGNEEGGYVLARVGVEVAQIQEAFNFQLCGTNDSAEPDETDCTALTPNTTTATNEIVYGTPVQRLVLEANTAYVVHVGESGELSDLRLPRTTSNDEDTQSREGWSIDNNRWKQGALGWSLETDATQNQRLKIRIEGHTVRGSETRLESLMVSGGSREVRQGVPLTPQFSPEGTTFDAGTIANEKLTIDATPMEEGTRVDIVDEEGTVVEDLDGDRENGYQTRLEAGENTVRIRVRGTNRAAMRIYTVTVTRPEGTSTDDYLERLVIENTQTGEVIFESPRLGHGRLAKIELPWKTR